jgi:8-oxo-dGTP diphosphatase
MGKDGILGGKQRDFDGAKLALISGGRILTMMRDDKPGIPFPGMLDLPGGGREGEETPVETVVRETFEEFGLVIDPDAIVFRKQSRSVLDGRKPNWFFGAVTARFDPGAVRFGDEGQGWEMMALDAFLAHPRGIPHLQDRVRDFLRSRSG